jgi:hypothetical protein
MRYCIGSALKGMNGLFDLTYLIRMLSLTCKKKKEYIKLLLACLRPVLNTFPMHFLAVVLSMSSTSYGFNVLVSAVNLAAVNLV